MKPFSLQTGDKFVHQKTAGIYTFDGLIHSTATDKTEIAYHNTLQESFTGDMGEFFGYTENKTKRFLPLDEYLKENEERNVTVGEYSDNHEEVLLSLLGQFELNEKTYIFYSYEADEVNNEEDTPYYIGAVSEEDDDWICLVHIEDDEEFQAACDKAEEIMVVGKINKMKVEKKYVALISIYSPTMRLFDKLVYSL